MLVLIIRIFVLFSFIDFICGFNVKDYCDLTCKKGGNIYKHTVCERKSTNCGPAASCVNYEDVTFTNAERQKLLDKHNELRSKVATGLETRGGGQPKASNMNALKYSMELEFIAQCHINQCDKDLYHDNCRRTKEFPYVGQNINTKFQSIPFQRSEYINHNLDQILSWYNEVKMFGNREIIKRFHLQKGTGHYTQIVWAETEYVGCARAAYQDGGWSIIQLVCNYAGRDSSGNLLANPMYLTGEPCSQCKQKKCNVVWKGLCGDDIRFGNSSPDIGDKNHRMKDQDLGLFKKSRVQNIPLNYYSPSLYHYYQKPYKHQQYPIPGPYRSVVHKNGCIRLVILLWLFLSRFY